MYIIRKEDLLNHTYSLVFVTGLAGHAYGSWKASNLETMWIQDFLAPDLVVSDVRILTYGYDSALLESTSNAGLREFAFQFLCALDSARRNSEVSIYSVAMVRNNTNAGPGTDATSVTRWS